MKKRFETFSKSVTKSYNNAIFILKSTWGISHSYIILSVISCLINSVCPLLLTYFNGLLLNALTMAEHNKGDLITLVALLVFTAAGLALFNCVANKNLSVLGARVNHEFLLRIHSKSIEMDYAFTEDKAVSEKRELALSGIRRIGGVSAYVNMLAGIIGALITIISITIAFFSINIVILIVIVIIKILTVRWENIKKRKAYEFDQMNDKMNVTYSYTYFLTHDLQAAKDARVFDLLSLYRKKMEAFQEQSFSNNNKRAIVEWKYTAFLTIATHFYLLFSYGLFAVQAILNPANFTIGKLSIAVSYASQLNKAFGSIINDCFQFFYNGKYIDQYRSYLDMKNTLQRTGIETLPMKATEYVFRFENVSFQYPGTKCFVLKNVNCEIKSQQRTAIVGENGSGKSTFIKLLLRLYDPTEGRILLNGKDIKDYAYDEYLSAFSVVFQDYEVLPYTVRENVNLSVEYRDDERVNRCLELVGMKNRIQALDDGDLTYIHSIFNKKGVNFSGGEKQKIAIARALYKNSPVMVLDEPTAALDPRSEYEIFKMYRNTVVGKTAILISHRLSSCRICDDILVFQNGMLVEQGTHDTLISSKGLYSQLWEAQAQFYYD